jgi:hypothetical protein
MWVENQQGVYHFAIISAKSRPYHPAMFINKLTIFTLTGLLLTGNYRPKIVRTNLYQKCQTLSQREQMDLREVWLENVWARFAAI